MKLALARLRTTSLGARDARRSWPTRERLLVRLTDDAGLSGVGEAAPLPGYSRESLDEVERALAALDPASFSSRASIREALASAAELLPFSLPSARFALETALLDLIGRQRSVPAPVLLGAEPGATRPLAALLGPAADATLLTEGERAVASGYRCLKLKVGAPGALPAELAAIAALRARVGPDVRLRLDANGALASGELAARAAELVSLQLELFEEPGAALPAHVPLALDESLQGLGPEEAEARWRSQGASSIVLKPTALGGLEHCRALAERAHASGVGVIISHAFEGEIAWLAAAALALSLPPGPAHGLAPHAGLVDEGASRLRVQDGALRSWTSPGLGTMSHDDSP